MYDQNWNEHNVNKTNQAKRSKIKYIELHYTIFAATKIYLISKIEGKIGRGLDATVIVQIVMCVCE